MIDVRIHGKQKFELLADKTIESYGFIVTVYAGFIWNMADMPRILWEELGCPSDYAEESLIHDALYRTHLLDRKVSDKIFHSLLIRSGTLPAKAEVLYLGVRAGGQSAWDDNFPMLSHYRNYVKVEVKG